MGENQISVTVASELRPVLERAAVDQGRPLSNLCCKALADWAAGLEVAEQERADAAQRAADERKRYADLCAKHGLPEATPPKDLNEAIRRAEAAAFKADYEKRGHAAAVADWQPDIRGSRGPGEP